MPVEQMTGIREEQAIEFLVQEPQVAQQPGTEEEPIRTGAVRNLQSQLFTVRLWPEPLDDGGVEWRGKVDHVASGEGYPFRHWSQLIVYLEQMLRPGFRTGHGIG